MGIQINGSTDRITAIDGTIDFVSNIGNIGIITASNYVLQDSITIGAGSTVIKTVNGKFGIGVTPISILHLRPLDETNFLVRNEGSTVVLASETNSGRDNNRGMALEATQFEFIEGGSEKIRIDSSGRLLLGTTSVGSASAYYDNLIISNTTSAEGSGITLFAATNGFNAVDFADTAGVGRGRITYAHSDDSLRIDTAGGERLRITSAGVVSINDSTPETFATLQVKNHTTHNACQILLHGADQAQIILRDETGGSNTKCTTIRNDGGQLIFGTHNDAYSSFSEKLRIASNGQIATRGATGTSFNNAGNGDFGSFLTLNGGHTANQWGILSLEGNTSASGYSVGQIQFINQNNANGSSGANVQSRMLARIETFSVTSDSNAGDDSGGSLRIFTKPEAAQPAERLRIHSDGKISTGGISNPQGAFCIDTGTGGSQANSLELRRDSNSDYHAVSFFTGTTCDWSIGQNNAGDFEIFEDGSDSYTRLSVHTGGTVQVQNHLTSRNGIVQINQVTSTTRYSGSISSVDLITGSTFTPKTSAPRFLIMIFCPVNNSDDSDAGNQLTNYYHHGRIEYRKSGGGWIECNNQGSTSNQGGHAAHVELSPNRTGDQTTDYWSGNRYRMEHKQATILVTNVGDCGASGTVQFKLRGYSSNGNFIQIGQPHGHGTDDDYAVQPWGFTVFELAPDNNSYTAY